MMKKDNSTLSKKIALRKAALKRIEFPVVMETHGGYGKIFESCYAHITQGVVFEKCPIKSAILGKQRPSWAVYESDVECALLSGVGFHLPINFVDIDPYGSPWNTIDAFFLSGHVKSENITFVVNDGLRQNIQLTGGWNVRCLEQMIMKYGNGLYSKYLQICEELISIKSAEYGYKVSRFYGYYCGANNAMTHYMAELTRIGES